jgi:Ternary complex associated domain 9
MLERPKMLWFGKPPSEEDFLEAKNRDLTLEVVGAGALPDFRHARAAVFWATNTHFESAADLLEANLVQAIDAGLHLHIVVANDGMRKDVDRLLAQNLPPGAPTDRHKLRVDHGGSVGSYEAPNAALRHAPGPAANDKLQILLPEGVSLRNGQQFLLQRAFSDCKSIALHLITGGKSGALTFLVDATLAASNAGPRPQPYFAKLGEPQKLRDELRQYETYAEHHIAWHLRPNFQAERCIYGVEQGVLVGSFVQSSRSLWDAAGAGEGPLHIRTLFEETLAVWRSEAKKWPPEQPGSVVEPLEEFCDYSRVPVKRVEAAKVHGGTVHAPRSLWRKLLDLPHEYWLRSSIHGDMHGDNVRVRKQDAIVIDFAHATTGPMCADLASLEVWFAFKVLPDEALDREQWHKRVEELYHPDNLDLTVRVMLSEAPRDWVRDCLQEIRHIARTSTHSADEYKRVLAVYLLRHASFPPDKDCEEEDEYRRTYAYWLANRMVIALCATAPSQLEVA